MNPIKILMVDDVPANLIALEAIIEQEGIQIFKANSGNEALKIAWEHEIALALVDVQMPEMDGFELVEMLKSSSRTKEIICIFVTAISKEAKYAVKGLKAGAVDYLYKPLDPMVTHAKVGIYLELYKQRKAILTKNRELENFALRIQHSADINAIIDQKSFKIQEINPAIKEILGYEPPNLIGSSILDWVHPDDLEDFRSLIQIENWEKGLPVTVEKRFRTTRHEYLWLNIRMTKEKGVIFANARNVSETKSYIQKIIEAKDNAETARKVKETFLANMSHEIRTPIGGIIGLTRLLAETELDNDQKETVSLISNTSDSLLNIINDILDLSKIEAGKFHLEMIDFQVGKTVSNVINLLKAKVEEKGLTLKFKADSNLPEWAKGDPLRLNQILLNLIGNALKFTSKGGITVSASSKDEGKGQRISFTIEDTGIGIPKEKLATIFDSFSQVSSDTARKFGGTGLGLTISQRLIELHGGEISVSSIEGKGSAFSFTLLCEQSQKQSAENEENTQNPFEWKGLENRKILLVDDNQVNRMVGKRTLVRWGIEVSLAEDGKIAINMADDQVYDCILMDIQMPEVNGYEATKAIRASSVYNCNTPIIALTAAVLSSEMEKAISSGMDVALTKPFDVEKLYRTIENLIVNGRSEKQNHSRNYDRLDFNYLRQISQGNQQFMIQYLQAFTESAPTLLEKIITSYEKEAYEEMQHALQTLKQDFAYVGHEPVKELLNKLESQTTTHQFADNCKDLLNSLKEILDHALKDMQDALAKLEKVN